MRILRKRNQRYRERRKGKRASKGHLVLDKVEI
jgi:hypothetical protein